MNRGRRARRGTTRRQIAPSSNIPRSLSRFAPIASSNHQDVILKFTTSGVLNNPGGIAASKYYDVNCAYDVDPALGSTDTAGFNEWVTMYRYYRVLAFKVRLEICSKDDLPISITHGPFNLTPPGSTVGYDTYLGNPRFRRHLVSPQPSGAPVARFSTPNTQIQSIVGERYVLTDPNYASVTNGVPANKIFWGFSIAPLGGTLTNGVAFIVTIEMSTRFTERVVLDQ